METESNYDNTLDFSFYSQEKKSKLLYRNFIIFCLCFSVTHGSVDSVLDYASSELGAGIASFAGFSLYLCYTLSALFCAKPIVLNLGPKLSILCGLFSFLVYVGSFFLSIVLPQFAKILFPLGATLCGIGAGIVWTAQGAYYARNAQLYASISFLLQAQVNANFAAIFAACYLGFESVTKVLATIIYLLFGGAHHWRAVVFGTYSCLSFIAFLLCTQISHLEVTTVRKTTTWAELKSEVLAVVNGLRNSQRLLLLVPYQICFGFHSGFIGVYINRKIVAESFGDGYIGVMTAVAVT